MPKAKKTAETTVRPMITDPNKLDLDGYLVRLAAHGRRLARRFTWSCGPSALAKGKDVDDLVEQAVMMLFSKWKPEKYPDPWPFLLLELRTLMSNLERTPDNKCTVRVVPDRVETRREHDVVVENGLGNPSQTPEDVLLSEEELERRTRWRAQINEALLGELMDEPQLFQLYELAEKEDISKPQIVARRLGLEVKDVNNLQKRLKRIYARVERKVAAQYSSAGETP